MILKNYFIAKLIPAPTQVKKIFFVKVNDCLLNLA